LKLLSKNFKFFFDIKILTKTIKIVFSLPFLPPFNWTLIGECLLPVLSFSRLFAFSLFISLANSIYCKRFFFQSLWYLQLYFCWPEDFVSVIINIAMELVLLIFMILVYTFKSYSNKHNKCFCLKFHIQNQ
jgi:hypothetical protein